MITNEAIQNVITELSINKNNIQMSKNSKEFESGKKNKLFLARHIIINKIQKEFKIDIKEIFYNYKEIGSLNNMYGFHFQNTINNDGMIFIFSKNENNEWNYKLIAKSKIDIIESNKIEVD